jgi:hypothetical protein
VAGGAPPWLLLLPPLWRLAGCCLFPGAHSQPSSHPEPAQSLDRLQSEAAAGKFLQADLAGERSNPCPCKLQGLD